MPRNERRGPVFLAALRPARGKSINVARGLGRKLKTADPTLRLKKGDVILSSQTRAGIDKKIDAAFDRNEFGEIGKVGRARLIRDKPVIAPKGGRLTK